MYSRVARSGNSSRLTRFMNSDKVGKFVGPGIKSSPLSYSTIARCKDTKIVAIGGCSMQSSVTEGIHSGAIRPESVTLIGSRSWVSRCHSDWEDKPWGQSKRYLPKPMLDIANELFPNYPDEALLNFGMIKAIEAIMFQRMQDMNVNIINTEAQAIFQAQDGSLHANINGEVRCLSEDNNFHILNAATRAISPQELFAIGSGDLYSYSKKDSTDPIIMVGSGANLTWTARDFYNFDVKRPIIHVVPEGDRVRSDLESSLYCNMALSGTSINDSDGETVVEGINMMSGQQMVVRAASNKVYSAMGFEHSASFIQVNDPGKVTTIDATPKPEARYQATLMTGDKVDRVSDLRGTRVPPGNMKLNYLNIRHATGQYTPSENNALLLFDAWREAVIESAVARGIELSEDFFDKLKPMVKHIYANEVPKHENIAQVIGSIYDKSTPATTADGTEVSKQEFLEFIYPCTEEVLESAHIDQEDENLSGFTP